MKIFLAFLFLTLLNAHTPELILYSSSQTTQQVFPIRRTAVLSRYHEANNQNVLGPEARWLEYADGFSTATFETLFYSDCSQGSATLQARVDNNLTAYLNGHQVRTGNPWMVSSIIPFTLRCGLNNLTIKADNVGGPGAIIFKVTQDKFNCYKCEGSGVYNRDTCSCECLDRCTCSSPLMRWFAQPFCKCKCSNPPSCNPQNSYLDEKTCQCKCKKQLCQTGNEQDPLSCACRCISQRCSPRQRWDSNLCSCVRRCAFVIQQQGCPRFQDWDFRNCRCICRVRECRRGGGGGVMPQQTQDVELWGQIQV